MRGRQVQGSSAIVPDPPHMPNRPTYKQHVLQNRSVWRTGSDGRIRRFVCSVSGCFYPQIHFFFVVVVFIIQQ